MDYNVVKLNKKDESRCILYPHGSTLDAIPDELSRLLERSVDLVEAGAVRNPYVLAEINRTREVVYAA